MALRDGTDKNMNYRSLAAKISADCFVGSGVTGENYVQVFKDVAAAKPDIKLYGPDGVAEEAFTNPKRAGSREHRPAHEGHGGHPESRGVQEAQEPGGREVLRGLQKYNDPSPDPYAIYGYETMALALATLNAVGDKANDRKAVAEQLLNTKGRESVLGTYDITADGDTMITDYGLYDIKDGLPVFDKVIKGAANW